MFKVQQLQTAGFLEGPFKIPELTIHLDTIAIPKAGDQSVGSPGLDGLQCFFRCTLAMIILSAKLLPVGISVRQSISIHFFANEQATG